MSTARAERLRLDVGHARLEVCPALGGVVTEFSWDIAGRRMHWLRPAPEGSGFPPTDAAVFPLIPISNRVRDGRFRFQDLPYEMALNFPPEKHAIHGHGWQTAWDVTDRSESSCTLSFRHDAADWPSAYEATQRFTLSETEMAMDMAIRNIGDRAMPAGLGPHSYFIRTPEARVTAPVEAMWTGGPDVMPIDLVPLPDDRCLPDGIVASAIAMDNIFTGFAGDARIDWPEWEASLTMHADPVFGFLVVFTPPGEDFFCVEPVSNCTDGLTMLADGRDGHGIHVLEPGEQLSGTVTLTPHPPR